MKWFVVALAALFLLLQYELWFSRGGVLSIWHLKTDVSQQKGINQKLSKRNQVLVADIKDLKHGKQAIEERARNELGMVKKGETFYQVVKK